MQAGLSSMLMRIAILLSACFSQVAFSGLQRVKSSEIEAASKILKTFDLSDEGISSLQAVTFISAESSDGADFPITNRVRLLKKEKHDLWLMRQRQAERDGKNPAYWSFVAILVDKQRYPPSSYYFEFAPAPVGSGGFPEEIKPRVDCLRCHPNGPRMIRPQLMLNEASQGLLQKWNESIANYGLIRNVDNAGGISIETKGHLPFPFCTNCHDSKSGVRNSLFRRNALAIRYLVDTDAMPPGKEKLSAGQKHCIKEWLEGTKPSLPCLELRQPAVPKGKSMGLKATVSTQLHSFDVSGFRTSLRLKCGESVNSCHVSGSIDTSGLASGIELRDRHIQETLSPLGPIGLSSSIFDRNDLEDGKPIAIEIIAGGRVVRAPISVECSSDLTLCNIRKLSLRLKDFPIQVPNLFGFTFKGDFQIAGSFPLYLD